MEALLLVEPSTNGDHILVKGRESGMPDEDYWSTFFDPECILRKLECVGPINVLEFGCGYGSFTIAASRLITESIFTLDIDRDMVERTQKLALSKGMKNVFAEIRDFVSDGSGKMKESMDYVMLFNILHIESPNKLLLEALRVLKPNGLLSIIHWNYDAATPRGPSMCIRPRPEQCRAWAESVGFEFVRDESLACCKWHWGMLLRNPA